MLTFQNVWRAHSGDDAVDIFELDESVCRDGDGQEHDATPCADRTASVPCTELGEGRKVPVTE